MFIAIYSHQYFFFAEFSTVLLHLYQGPEHDEDLEDPGGHAAAGGRGGVWEAAQQAGAPAGAGSVKNNILRMRPASA